MNNFDMNYWAVFVLVDELARQINEDCDRCPVSNVCRNKYDPSLRGTECRAILRNWAYDEARELYLQGLSVEKACVCLVDNHHGRYIPQVFLEQYLHEPGWDFGKCSAEALDTVSKGPDEEHYWEAWDNIMQNASFTGDNGSRWTLTDGEGAPDLFMVMDVFGEVIYRR